MSSPRSPSELVRCAWTFVCRGKRARGEAEARISRRVRELFIAPKRKRGDQWHSKGVLEAGRGDLCARGDPASPRLRRGREESAGEAEIGGVLLWAGEVKNAGGKGVLLSG
jgi:hypothetical protein